MNRKQIIVLWVLLIVLIPIVMFFAVVVWPTKYKYLPYDGPYLVLRVNRFTGEAEGLKPSGGWKKFQGEKEKQPLSFDNIPKLPPEEAQKIDVIGSSEEYKRYYGNQISANFDVKLYNGSSYTLHEISITITAKEKNGDIRWSRQFRRDLDTKPETSDRRVIEIPSIDGAALSWTIDEFRGTPIIK
jgi:hypothetical protein